MLSLHRLAGDILNTAEASLNSKPKIQNRIQKPALFCLLKKFGPHSKMTPNKRCKTARLFARVETRSEGPA